jgi:GDPmannose 4,6-dehydratase
VAWATPGTMPASATSVPLTEPRRALITGVAGQDGGYLAEQLLADGHRVFGLVRGDQRDRAAALPWLHGVQLVDGDLRDAASLERALAESAPDELYNLASYSQPARAWSEPEASAEVNALGPLRLLEAIRKSGRPVRFVQAGTSEIFGEAANPQNEATPLRPITPYGAGKAYAHQVVGYYRTRCGVFACGAVLYNHESPRRPESFVTRKITRAAARIKLGLDDALVLGSLVARRDWGFAPDFTRALRLMLAAERADDYVVGTGRSHSVGDFARAAFARVGLDFREFVRTDPSFVPASSSVGLEADASRARERLGWTPSVSFEELVGLMVDADLEREQRAAGVGPVPA